MHALRAAEITQCSRQIVGCGASAQGRREYRQHIHAAFFQRGDQRIDEARVAAHPVGAVEHDADTGPRSSPLGEPVADGSSLGQIGVVDAVLG